MERNQDLNDLRNDIMCRVSKVTEDAKEFSSSFDTYSHLWCDDRQEFLRQFLTYGHILTQEEIEAHAQDGVPESPPTLKQFKEEIDSYEELYLQVSHFSDLERFDSWFKVSIRPFKQSLLNIIKKWSYMFKEELEIAAIENFWPTCSISGKYCGLCQNFRRQSKFLFLIHISMFGFSRKFRFLNQISIFE